MTQDSTLAITTHAWPEYTIDTVYDVHAPITTPHASLTFDSAALCTLYCSAAAHYLLSWPRGTDLTRDTLVISVTKDSTVTSTARMIPPCTIDTTGGWGGYLSSWTITPALINDSGTTVTMMAACEACSSFSGYTGDYTGGTASASFTITGNMSIGAGCEWNGACGGGSRLKFLRSRRGSLTIGTFEF